MRAFEADVQKSLERRLPLILEFLRFINPDNKLKGEKKTQY